MTTRRMLMLLSAVAAVVFMLPGCCLVSRSTAPADSSITVEGSVTDADGSPVPGVRVYYQRGGGHTNHVSVTDDEGRYRFADVNPGECKLSITDYAVSRLSCEYAVWPRGYRMIHCPTGGVYTCDLDVRKCGSVEVRFTGNAAKQRPPTSVAMDLIDRRHWNYYWLKGRVHDGKAELRNIPPGVYDATFKGRGMISCLKEIEVLSGTTLQVEIHLQDAKQLEGAVVDEFGTALQNVRVRLQGDLSTGTRHAETVTDRKGQFRILSLADGEVKLMFDYHGFLSTNTIATIPQSNLVSVVMAKGDEISGRVTLADGTPAACVIVQARASAWRGNVNVRDLTKVKNNGSLSWMRRTDDKGEFVLTGFPGGQYDITAGCGVSNGRFGYGTNECSVLRGVHAGTVKLSVALPATVTKADLQIGLPVGCIDVGEGMSVKWERDRRWLGGTSSQSNHERVRNVSYEGRDNVLYMNAVDGVTIVSSQPVAFDWGSRYECRLLLRNTEGMPVISLSDYKLRPSIRPGELPSRMDLGSSSCSQVRAKRGVASSNQWREIVFQFPAEKHRSKYKGPASDDRQLLLHVIYGGDYTGRGEAWIAEASIKRVD